MEWQPIETAPKGNPESKNVLDLAGPRVLLRSGDYVFIGRQKYSYKRRDPAWKDDHGHTAFRAPDAWMPLPSTD